MLYREAGQFRTSYAQDSQIFPLRQDRVGMVIMLIAAVMLPVRRQQLLAERDPHSMAHSFAGGARAEHPDGLCRPAFARIGRLHGRRRVRLLQFDPAHRRHSVRGRGRAFRRLRGSGRHRLRPAEPAHPRTVSRGRDARVAVLHRLGAGQVRLVQELRPGGRDHRAADRHVRPQLRNAAREVLGGAGDRRGARACSPRTWRAAASGAAGWRCATWMSRPK